MRHHQYLMIPGPTPVPQTVALAGAAPMINHRGPEFGELLKETTRGVQQILKTSNTVLTFPAAGTGAMEAAAVNLMTPGERVLVGVAGEFGARFAEILRVGGADVATVKSEPGYPVSSEAIRDALRKDPSITTVVVTHNETSTGVTMDLPGIRAAIDREDVLFVVDAVSSAGAVDIETDGWGIDVLVTASQKALMCPPGLAFVAVSPKAWDRVEKTRARSVYFSFANARKFLEKPTPQTPYTPAVSLLFSLREAVRQIFAEGPDAVFARHALLARATRAGMRALGLELLAADEWASNTVTAVKLPAGVDGHRLLGALRDRYGVILAGGMGELAGKIFRIGHVGAVSWSDIVVTLSALQMALSSLGVKAAHGAAVAAAERVFSEHGWPL
ncbi:MAG: alanine--glyoxylate aminotransferase family protein [Firmicutes bacterium]|nr:alanine--glyoxylate aminotransferase family protein [Bacillota bacterium]